jgi:lipoyl-dependent peroxiredoxin
MAVSRQAQATWSGDLLSGSGQVTYATSGSITRLPVSWASRTGSPEGQTSPEELVAAAHAACFSMAFSNGLAKNGTPPNRLDVTAVVSFDKLDAGWRLTNSDLTVRGDVPGIDADRFQALAEEARDGCPVSQALKGNVELSVDATLES